MPRQLAELPRASDVIRHFTPSWFTVTMGTGIVANLIGSFPYDMPAKNEVGWAFWWCTLALFCLFSAALAARFVCFPAAGRALFQQPFQAVFLGAIPPSLSSITNGMPMFLAQRWGRHAVMEAAVWMWWANAVLSMLCTVIIPYFMFQHGDRASFRLDRMTAVWLLPIIPCVVSSAGGGLIAREASLDHADNIIQMSLILWGIGVPLSFGILTILYRRLVAHSLPPQELIVSSFLPVSPCSMGAVAMLTISQAIVRLNPPPTYTDIEAAFAAGGAPAAAQAALQAGYMAASANVARVGMSITALILWGAACWWALVAVLSVSLSLRGLRFGIGFWGAVFPLGAYATAANLLWVDASPLPGMRQFAAFMIALVMLLWAGCMAFTLLGVWRGTLLYPPDLQKRLPSKALDASDAEDARSGNGSGDEGDKDEEQLPMAGPAAAEDGQRQRQRRGARMPGA